MKLEGAEVKNIYGICSKIGGDPKAELRIRIPYYQRPYKWTVRHIENLFLDFFQNLEDSDEKEYFVGSVVLVKTESDEYYEVVDGQQRTTTVFLLNYLSFLLQRTYIEELIAAWKIAAIPRSVEHLYESLKMLAALEDEDKVIYEDFCSKISGRLDEIQDIEDEKTKDDESDKLLRDFRALFGLPLTKDISQKEIHAVSVSNELKAYLNKYDLTLLYDRKSYNDLLKKALSGVGVVYSSSYSPEFVVTEELDKDSPIAVYVEALEKEFNCLKERAQGNEKPIKCIEQMIADISCMLDNLSFCKILTGNEQDAYTLFEVLNDRALAVDDLELVKNMFFKKYCNKSADKENIKDKNIESLDDLWGDTIFKGTGATQTQIISYCSSVYLTGTTELVTNKGQRFRDVLQEKYLNNKKTYEYADVCLDFQIFQAVRMITDKANLRYQTEYKFALIAENDINKSNVYKTLNLIHAMSYSAVLPALINVIIRTYCDINKERPLDMDKFGKYLDEIMTVPEKEEYESVYKCADVLRRATLLGKDYQIPRKIARTIIERNYKDNSDSSAISITSDDFDALKEEYQVWTRNWRYGSDKQNFRLKVLFLNLYQTEKTDTTIDFKVAKYSLPGDVEVALDHLDAQNKDMAAAEKYFEPEDNTLLREDYVNSIGNMMILDGHNNGDKNNKPLYRALEYHKKLANHWLVTEIEEMLNDDAYSKSVNSGVEEWRVANEKFFVERTNRLQKYFYAMINRKKGEDEVSVED